MTPFVHYTGTMPKRRPPPAPVVVSPNGVEYEPAAFHLRVAELLAAETRHLTQIERQVHVFRGVAVQIIDFERTSARRKVPGRKGVRAAARPAAAVATRGFRASRGADSRPVRGTIAP